MVGWRRVGLIIGLAVVAVLAGCAGNPTTTPTETTAGVDELSQFELVERWRAGESTIQGNHHAIAAGRIDGEAIIAVPLGGRSGQTGCRLLVLDGSGDKR